MHSSVSVSGRRPNGRLLRAARRGGSALLLLGLLAGCFESEEEAAVSAFRDRDYDRAARLADSLAEDNHPRGYEIQALLAAQGIGVPQDFARATALMDEAVALDPAYDSSRSLILERVRATEKAAEAALDRGDHANALRLARPLADYGSDTGREILDRLYSDHQVLLPGSDLTWRAFWNRCSGSIRDEDEATGTARFQSECLGRRIVWDGTIVRAREGEITVKMRPGRSRAPQDLVLDMIDAPEDPIETFGRKVRFAGIVAGRGSVSKPDRLEQAAVLGPAWMTRADEAEAEQKAADSVRTACVDLLTHLYKTSHAPAWVGAARRRAEENDWPEQPMAFSIRITSPDDAFRQQADESWRADVEGVASIILARVKPSRYTEIAFSGHCDIRRLGIKDPTKIGSAEIFEEEIRIDFES